MPDVSPQVTPGKRRSVPLAVVVALGLAGGVFGSGCAASSRGPNAARAVRYYPAPPSAPRVAYLADIGDLPFSYAQPSGIERFLFGTRGTSGGRIGKPFGLAAAKGKLFVCDTKRHIVHVFDLANGAYTFFGESEIGRLNRPVAIALDELGNRFVADVGRGEIVVFSAANEPIRALRPLGAVSFKPVAVAFHKGELFAADGESRQVVAMDPIEGNVLRTMGDGVSGSSFGMPSGIAIDTHERILVSDALNARVNLYTVQGDPIGFVGQPGDRAGCFARPKHLTVAPDGILYAIDAAFQRVQMFDDSDRVLMLFGGPGDGPGCLTMPAGIAVDAAAVPFLEKWIPAGFDARYIVFVSDQFGPWGVRIYAFGQVICP